MTDTFSVRDHSLLERILRRERLIIVAAVVMLSLLAWVYLLTGAGTGMSSFAMSGWWPAQDASQTAGGAVWTPAYAALIAAMWWVMMVAMMLPSAAPMILLHRRVTLQAQRNGTATPRAATGVFAAGYLLVWAVFSALATAVQFGLDFTGLLSSGFMASRNLVISAAILILTGVYQLSPLKQACLRTCRSPAELLSRVWRPGAWGALRGGIVHGAYCVGCCAALMALLFVGGVMNLVWIAVLSALVAIEKLLPGGTRFGRTAGVLFIAAGLALLYAHGA